MESKRLWFVLRKIHQQLNNLNQVHRIFGVPDCVFRMEGAYELLDMVRDCRCFDHQRVGSNFSEKSLQKAFCLFDCLCNSRYFISDLVVHKIITYSLDCTAFFWLQKRGEPAIE